MITNKLSPLMQAGVGGEEEFTTSGLPEVLYNIDGESFDTTTGGIDEGNFSEIRVEEETGLEYVESTDDLHTSEEEKLEAAQKVKELVSNYEVEMEKTITERWKVDMNSDSWLSKNIRPMVLIFLVVATVLMIFIDAGVVQFEVKDTWVDLLQLVLITVIGAYFGGRSLEKVKK
jgi:hypothetical protein